MEDIFNSFTAYTNVELVSYPVYLSEYVLNKRQYIEIRTILMKTLQMYFFTVMLK